MGVKLTKKPAVATMTETSKQKGKVIAEEVSEEKVNVPDEVTGQTAHEAAELQPYCEVGVEASYTKNMGDFNSARVAVSIKVPCLHPEIDKVFDYAQTWVDAKLSWMVDELGGA